MTTAPGKYVAAIYWIGVAIDAIAALALATPADSIVRQVAYPGVSAGQLAFADGTRSALPLMLGWTLLLAWGGRRPLERRAVLALTAFVVAGLIAVELVDVNLGHAAFEATLPTLALQAVLEAWLLSAWAIARRAASRQSGGSRSVGR